MAKLVRLRTVHPKISGSEKRLLIVRLILLLIYTFNKVNNRLNQTSKFTCMSVFCLFTDEFSCTNCIRWWFSSCGFTVQREEACTWVACPDTGLPGGELVVCARTASIDELVAGVRGGVVVEHGDGCPAHGLGRRDEAGLRHPTGCCTQSHSRATDCTMHAVYI